MTLDPSGLQPAPAADAPPTETAAPPARLTMQQILEAMTAPERMLDAIAEQGMDCGELVGDMQLSDVSDDDAREALGRKVDALRFVVTEFEAYAKRTDDRADTLAAKAKSAWNQAGRIRVRLLEQMTMFEFEKLPGIDFEVARVRSSNPSAPVLTRQPTAEDMLTTPHLVSEIPHSYAWRTEAVKADLKAGAIYSFAAPLKYTYSVKFKERDRPDVAPKKKKAKPK